MARPVYELATLIQYSSLVTAVRICMKCSMRLTNVNGTMCKTTVKLVTLRHKESVIDIQGSRILLTIVIGKNRFQHISRFPTLKNKN